MEDQHLTKREKRELAKERKQEEKVETARSSMLKKITVLLIVLGVIGLGVRMFRGEAEKPLPGQTVEDIGREHTTNIAEISYNSNPPTSGTHFPIWAKKGVYDRVISDGYLIHSLEHGYVVISYNCSSQFQSSLIIRSVSAHETEEPHEEPVATDSGETKPLSRMNIKIEGSMSWFTPDNQPEVEVGLTGDFEADSCKELVLNLSKFTEKWDRVIVVPRPQLDSQIALTAWTKIDKFSGFDEDRIEEFIKAYHNRGPEKTVE